MGKHGKATLVDRNCSASRATHFFCYRRDEKYSHRKAFAYGGNDMVLGRFGLESSGAILLRLELRQTQSPCRCGHCLRIRLALSAFHVWVALPACFRDISHGDAIGFLSRAGRSTVENRRHSLRPGTALGRNVTRGSFGDIGIFQQLSEALYLR